jgi:hypothetical protein
MTSEAYRIRISREKRKRPITSLLPVEGYVRALLDDFALKRDFGVVTFNLVCWHPGSYPKGFWKCVTVTSTASRQPEIEATLSSPDTDGSVRARPRIRLVRRKGGVEAGVWIGM